MTTRYVGKGGNDANNGLTWATRKLTLNGVEDTPVVAGDIVYVGAGVYAEQLTCDVNGGAGTEIVYIADVTGEHTDGVGGIVRITACDNWTTMARSYCIYASAKSHRTFNGFYLYMGVNAAAGFFYCSYITVEDCYVAGGTKAIHFQDNATARYHTVQRCVVNGFYSFPGGIFFECGAAVDDDSECVVENCLITNSRIGVHVAKYSGVDVRRCTFTSNAVGMFSENSSTVTPSTARDCVFAGNDTHLSSNVAGALTENYNLRYYSNINLNNVSAGANSVTHQPNFRDGLQVSGYRMPRNTIGTLHPLWSKVARKTGSEAGTEDIYGIERPVTNSKQSWGAFQVMPATRNDDQADTRHAYGWPNMVLDDAGKHQIICGVTPGVEHFLQAWVKVENDYLPSDEPTAPLIRVIDQDGTELLRIDYWNQMSFELFYGNFTPSASSRFVTIELISSNTQTVGDYKVFFDELWVES